ncbi:hypothetical protein HNQ07_004250 [Deinococcus metalli]|uniref:Antitoxin VbhA domain-containing protein n=1 Tax=Deinococcus metalli TaxID=1141878 RepID=A0A7W8KK84_9DEIO|nr:antitoxin VbhA family protein [Deinococcus metalli]MBB5378743.1 hypothetical protein [Deinococcus metalli]GHF60292.1 hypothetical protein GCM10017781_40570 [Deinococcus metalli]
MTTTQNSDLLAVANAAVEERKARVERARIVKHARRSSAMEGMPLTPQEQQWLEQYVQGKKTTAQLREEVLSQYPNRKV